MRILLCKKSNSYVVAHTLLYTRYGNTTHAYTHGQAHKRKYTRTHIRAQGGLCASSLYTESILGSTIQMGVKYYTIYASRMRESEKKSIINRLYGLFTMHFYIFGFWQARNEAKTNEREPYNVRRNQRTHARLEWTDGTDEGKRHEIKQDSLMLQSQPNNTDFVIVLMWLVCDITVDGVDSVSDGWRWRRRRRQRRWWRHCFRFCFPLLSFFSTSRMPHTLTQNYKPRKIFVHTFSANINMHKSLMNLTLAYVLHWAQFVWVFLLALFSG